MALKAEDQMWQEKKVRKLPIEIENHLKTRDRGSAKGTEERK